MTQVMKNCQILVTVTSVMSDHEISSDDSDDDATGATGGIWACLIGNDPGPVPVPFTNTPGPIHSPGVNTPN